MLARIEEAKAVGGHKIWLRFANGSEGTVDLSGELEGEIFEPLRDPAYFALVKVDATSKTVTWPNGADFAPEFLLDILQRAV